MKRNLLLIFLLLNSAFAFGQNGLDVKGYFGFSGTRVGPTSDFAEGVSLKVKEFKEFGLMFSSGIGGKFRLNGGLSYSYGKVWIQCDLCSRSDLANPYNQDFRMLSFPVFAEYELTNFFFVAAGPLLDFHLSEGNNLADQSGLGYLVGLGGKVKTEKFTFSVFPNYKRHALFPFDKPEGSKSFLQEFGLQLGVGYLL